MLWTLRSSRAWSLPCRPQPRSFKIPPNRRLPRYLSNGPPKQPSFTEELAREKPIPSFTESVRKVPIRNQIMFTFVGTVGALTVGAHMTNYELFKWWGYLWDSPQGGYNKERPPTSEELARVKYYALGRQLQTGLASLKSSVDQLPETMKAMITWSYVQVFQPILNATEGKRMCWAIGAVNCLVWLAWRVPRWGPVMLNSFAHNAQSGKSYTLFTHMFSHENFFHLFFNCFALASFGAAASQSLMLQFKKVEQERGGLSEASPKWHLLAVFVSAGLFAGLVSHVGHARWTYPRLIAKIQAESSATATAASSALRTGATSTATPRTIASLVASAEESAGSVAHALKRAHEGSWSLGSSGAVYALLAITALGFPDAEITFIIPPWFPINIQTGFFTILAFDVLGVLRGWRVLDHFGHLGGALFGFFWFKYGADIWYNFRLWDLPASFYLHGHGTRFVKKKGDKGDEVERERDP